MWTYCFYVWYGSTRTLQAAGSRELVLRRMCSTAEAGALTALGATGWELTQEDASPFHRPGAQ